MDNLQEQILRRRSQLMIGDCDKPFHLPECECDDCEAWRVRQGRPKAKDGRMVLDALEGK